MKELGFEFELLVCKIFISCYTKSESCPMTVLAFCVTLPYFIFNVASPTVL